MPGQESLAETLSSNGHRQATLRACTQTTHASTCKPTWKPPHQQRSHTRHRHNRTPSKTTAAPSPRHCDAPPRAPTTVNHDPPSSTQAAPFNGPCHWSADPVTKKVQWIPLTGAALQRRSPLLAPQNCVALQWNGISGDTHLRWLPIAHCILAATSTSAQGSSILAKCSMPAALEL